MCMYIDIHQIVRYLVNTSEVQVIICTWLGLELELGHNMYMYMYHVYLHTDLMCAKYSLNHFCISVDVLLSIKYRNMVDLKNFTSNMISTATLGEESSSPLIVRTYRYTDIYMYMYMLKRRKKACVITI